MSAYRTWFPSRRLFEVDWDALSEVELVALAIGPGINQEQALKKAIKLLQTLGSAQKLREMSFPELCQGGLSRERALSILAAMHLFRRLQQTALRPGQTFRSSTEIVRHFQPLMEGLKKECFWNVLLDGKNRITRLVKVSEGSLTSSLVHPREVFRVAIRAAAVGVLFVHNHPSGDPAPSSEDMQITKRLAETGKIIGIRVLDHIIIGAPQYFSFADQGLL